MVGGGGRGGCNRGALSGRPSREPGSPKAQKRTQGKGVPGAERKRLGKRRRKHLFHVLALENSGAGGNTARTVKLPQKKFPCPARERGGKKKGDGDSQREGGLRNDDTKGGTP